jgi:hypothetical protein
MTLPEEDMQRRFAAEIRASFDRPVTRYDVTVWIDEKMVCAGYDRKSFVRDCVWLRIESQQRYGV